MKLLAANSSALKKIIDWEIPPERSIVGRYRNVVQLDEQPDRDRDIKKYLLHSSIKEGARIFPFMRYRDVEIDLLDETSAMATGTLKSIDGCLTTAFCLADGVKQTVFESGGNTGDALTRYGQKAGLETFFFCPLANIDLLDSSIFQSPRAHLAAVADRGMVKETADYFAATTGIRHVPEKIWRSTAAMFRGLFILEQLLTAGKYDWLCQSISAGFGPIGIYSILQQFLPELRELPRFLGIQQESNCPMFAMWKPEAASRLPVDGAGEKTLLTRVMYDETPQTYQTFKDMKKLLQLTTGDLLTINTKEFNTLLYPSPASSRILELLAEQTIPVSIRNEGIIEKTGLIALLGAIKAIDTGRIRAGSRILCCLTSGVSKSDAKARPEAIIRNRQDVEHYAGDITKGSN